MLKENKIEPEDNAEEIARKQMYAKLCAHKKPYFFMYNYSHLKTEYDTYVNTAKSNAVSLCKKELDDLLFQYSNGLFLSEEENKFVKNFNYEAPLDRSKSTMNRICWAIEKEFDSVNLFKDVDFDYTILKSNIMYDNKTFGIIKHLCESYKPNIQLAKKHMFMDGDCEEDIEWESVDIILQNLVENLQCYCSNEEELCEILLDLCYNNGVSKQILWKACGETIIDRLLRTHGYKMTYPQKVENGDFWCQGIQYCMNEIVKQGGKEDEEV